MAKPSLLIAGESFSSDKRSVARPEAQPLDFRPVMAAAREMSSAGEEIKRLDDAQALANAQQQATEEMSLLQRELREAGGAAEAQQLFLQRSAEINDRISSQLGGDRQRERFGTMWDELYSGHRLKVMDAAMAKGVAVSKDLFRATASRLSDAASEEDDPRLYGNWMRQIDRGVSDLVSDGVMGEKEGAMTRQNYYRRAAVKTAQRLIERDPVTARRALQDGDPRFEALTDDDHAEFRDAARDAVAQKEIDDRTNRRADETSMRERARVSIDSIEKTGKLPDDDFDLNSQDIKNVLGGEAAKEWNRAKREARNAYYTNQHLSKLTAPEIESYISKHPDASPKLLDRARGIIKDRAADPVRAANETFGRAELDLDNADPAVVGKTLERRAQDQETLGVSGNSQRTLTNGEATKLAGRYSEMQAQGPNGVQSFMKDMDRMFGSKSQDAFRDVLLTATDDHDLATVGANVGRKIGVGVPPSTADAQTMTTIKAASSAEKAFSPSAAPRTDMAWKPGNVPGGAVPNYQQIQMLLAKPDLSSQFEQKFGAGAARFYLDQQQRAQRASAIAQGKLDNAGTQ